MKVELKNIPIRLADIKFSDYTRCPSCSFGNRKRQFVFIISPYYKGVVGLYILNKKNCSICDYYALNFKKSMLAKQFLLLLLRSNINFIRRITNAKRFIYVPL